MNKPQNHDALDAVMRMTAKGVPTLETFLEHWPTDPVEKLDAVGYLVVRNAADIAALKRSDNAQWALLLIVIAGVAGVVIHLTGFNAGVAVIGGALSGAIGLLFKVIGGAI